jgi:hypothetical protein
LVLHKKTKERNRNTGIDTQQEGYVKMEAEIRVILPHAKESKGIPRI